MTITKLLAAGAALLMVCGLGSRSAQADMMDHETIFTFSSAVRIPGAVLAPGTYDFKRLGTNPNILQIFDKDNMHLVATVQMLPDELTKTPSDAVVTLTESINGSPARMVSWTYPGDNTAEDFVYPHVSKKHLQAALSVVGAPKS